MLELILLEDEPVLCQELAEFLDDSGFGVTVAANLAEFDRQFDPRCHRIAVVDLGLPDGDGAQLIPQLRAANPDLGIVVLTARDNTRDKVAGLAGGADHYLGKSVDLDELAATIAALGRRVGESAPTESWVLEMGPRRLCIPGFEAIDLSHQDCLVLHTLMEAGGEIVSRQQIVAALGASFLAYDQRRLDTQMRRLRRKVEQATGQPLPVKTSRNAGYSFFAPAEVVS
jgi:DNA-binding response OmpR family regulator